MRSLKPREYKCRLPEEEKELINFAVNGVADAGTAESALDALMVPGVMDRESFQIDHFQSREDWLGYVKWIADYLPALKALSDYDFLASETRNTLCDISYVALMTYEGERAVSAKTLDRVYLLGVVSIIRGCLSTSRETLSAYASHRLSETIGLAFSNPGFPYPPSGTGSYGFEGGNVYMEEIYNLWLRNKEVETKHIVETLEAVVARGGSPAFSLASEILVSSSYKRMGVLEGLGRSRFPVLNLTALRNAGISAELEEYIVTKPDALVETIIVGLGPEMRTPESSLKHFLYDERQAVRYAAMVRLMHFITEEYIYEILTVPQLEWYESLKGVVDDYWFLNPSPSAYFSVDEEWWRIASITYALSLVDQDTLNRWSEFDSERVSKIMLIKVLN